jgi:tetratricopeptide (TPR) repeat protein
MRELRGLIGGVLLCGHVTSAGPLDKPSFTATPDELLAAAKAAHQADAPVVVLQEDASIAFDDAGRAKERRRIVFVVQTQEGVEDWGTIQLGWSPFYQNKPTVRARVITSRDQVAEIDPKLVTDAPTTSDSPSVFSDKRKLEAPLPRLAINSVVEEELVLEDREPMLAAGTVSGFAVQRTVPVQHTVVALSAPTKHPLHLGLRGFAGKPPVPRQTTQNGRTTWTYDVGPMPAHEHRPEGVPNEIVTWPTIGYATGASWAAVASEYRKIVDERISKGTPSLPAELKAAADRPTIDRIVAWLHAHVRYTGIEFSEAAIVPWPPAETLKRGFGDCKDKATLLVALLRAAGIQADLVLLDSGPGVDMDPTLAGMGMFDHAIVRARVANKDVWIDATEDMLPAGQLPLRDQGRLGLVVAGGTTALVRSPMSTSTDNTVHEVRTFHIAEHDHSTVTETSTETGVFSDSQRSWIRNNKHADVSKNLNDYAVSEYAGKLAKFTSTDPTDITRPFMLTVEVDDVRRVFTQRRKVQGNLARAAALNHVPAIIRTKSAELDREVKERRFDYVWQHPFVAEIEYRLELPPGYSPPQLVAREAKQLGTITLTTQRKVDHDTIVITYRLDTGKVRLSPGELLATRTAVRELLDGPQEHIEIQHTGFMLADQGKTIEAIDEIKRSIALHPKEALHYGQLADVYRQAGMGSAARRAARKGVEIEPTADAYNMVAWQLRRDTLGREDGFDADRKGAIEAYRKALSINPDHLGATADLASLLAHDATGQISSDHRDQLEAIKLWRHAKQLSEDDAYDQSIVVELLTAGLFAEAETAARALSSSDPLRAQEVLAAIAAQHGAKEAIHQVDAIAPGQPRKQVLLATASQLLVLRRYDEARTIFAEVRDTNTDARTVAIFTKVAPADLSKLAKSDPRYPAVTAFAIMLGLSNPAKPPWDAAMAHDLEIDAMEVRRAPALKQLDAIPRAIATDIIVSLAQPAVEGDARDGWRVVLDFGVAKAVFYEVAVNGNATLIGTQESLSGVGGLMLKLLARGDVKAAAKWWKWLASDLDGLGTNDAAVATVYKDELAKSGASEPSKELLEQVAALLVATHDPKVVAPILKRCAPKSDRLKIMCVGYLAGVYGSSEDWAAVVDLVEHQPTTDPVFPVIASQGAYALTMLGRFEAAAKLIDGQLAQHPDDLDLLRARTSIADAGKWADAPPWFDKLLAHPHVRANDFNNVAWSRLFYDPSPEKAREVAARGERMGEPDAALANTLAAIEAESDHPHAAWTYLQGALAARKHVEPSPADWYVIGRIAETYGLRDDAIAAYRHITKPTKRQLAPTGYDFAQRRLTKLGVH